MVHFVPVASLPTSLIQSRYICTSRFKVSRQFAGHTHRRAAKSVSCQSLFHCEARSAFRRIIFCCERLSRDRIVFAFCAEHNCGSLRLVREKRAAICITLRRRLYYLLSLKLSSKVLSLSDRRFFSSSGGSVSKTEKRETEQLFDDEAALEQPGILTSINCVQKRKGER